MTVAVSRAKGAGAEAVICASTGNTAASAAAYAARAGLRGAVIVPEGKIAIGKLAQALDPRRPGDRAAGQFRPGARDRPRARRHTSGRARQLGQPVSDRGPEDGGLRGRRGARRGTRRDRDPGRQRRQRDRVVAGLRRARCGAAAATASRPRAPRPWSAARPSPSPRPSPRRSGSAIQPAGRRRWRRSPPRAAASTAVSDEQILDAYRLLASARGRLLRAGLGGVGRRHPRPRAARAGRTGRHPRTVVCVLTGHGLKDPDTALSKAPPVIGCENDLAEVERAVVRLRQAQGEASGTACAPRRIAGRASCGIGSDRSPSARSIGLLVPPRCAICARATSASALVCEACSLAIEAAPSGNGIVAGVGRVTWSAPYAGEARGPGRGAEVPRQPAACRDRGAIDRRRIARRSRSPDGGSRAAGAVAVPAPWLRPRRADRRRGRGGARPRSRGRAATLEWPAPGRPRPRRAAGLTAARAGDRPRAAERAAGRRRADHRRDARGLRAGRCGPRARPRSAPRYSLGHLARRVEGRRIGDHDPRRRERG